MVHSKSKQLCEKKMPQVHDLENIIFNKEKFTQRQTHIQNLRYYASHNDC